MKKFLLVLILSLTGCAYAYDAEFKTLNDLSDIPNKDKTYAFHHQGYILDVRFEKKLRDVLEKHGWALVSNQEAKHVIHFGFDTPYITLYTRLRSYGVFKTDVENAYSSRNFNIYDQNENSSYFLISIRTKRKVSSERFGKEVFSAMFASTRFDLNRDDFEQYALALLDEYLDKGDVTRYYHCTYRENRPVCPDIPARLDFRDERR